MSRSWQRRMGILMVIVLLLTAVLVPAAAASPVEGRSERGSAAAAAGAGAPQCAVYHHVQRGENLTQISRKYGVTIWDIMRWNNIKNMNLIYAGTTLVIWRSCPRPQPTPPPPPPASYWYATYYNTRDLTGGRVFERREAQINHNWGWSSPAAPVFPDNFSARWTRVSNAVGGTYRITVRTDDGARVYVDGVLVLDSWQVQAVRTYEVDVVLVPGWHTWTVEYFEAEGVAEISFNVRKL
ncbi:MAG: N-acetylmuramoyl-L-alanine amidase XlyA precursor [Chloroflexi bacterium ADurb.Bin325]|nr:MAG: N-acetylmuramoyl-L-alanine amidase XlyA precursor [Chloroflexi bacterium ADurb.Bin325]